MAGIRLGRHKRYWNCWNVMIEKLLFKYMWMKVRRMGKCIYGHQKTEMHRFLFI